MEPIDTTNSRDVFVALILKSFVETFELSQDRLRWLAEFMRSPGTDHFAYAYQKAHDGMVVFLLTNLVNVFHMETDIDLAERLHLSYFRHDAPEGYFLLKVNPVVNRLLALTNSPTPTTISGDRYALIRKAEAAYRATNLEEIQALAFLRTKGNRAVRFEYKDDRLTRVVIERSEPAGSDLDALLHDEAFQTVTVNMADGQTRTVERTISQRLESGVDETGKRLPVFIRVGE